MAGTAHHDAGRFDWDLPICSACSCHEVTEWKRPAPQPHAAPRQRRAPGAPRTAAAAHRAQPPRGATPTPQPTPPPQPTSSRTADTPNRRRRVVAQGATLGPQDWGLSGAEIMAVGAASWQVRLLIDAPCPLFASHGASITRPQSISWWQSLAGAEPGRPARLVSGEAYAATAPMARSLRSAQTDRPPRSAAAAVRNGHLSSQRSKMRWAGRFAVIEAPCWPSTSDCQRFGPHGASITSRLWQAMAPQLRELGEQDRWLAEYARQLAAHDSAAEVWRSRRVLFGGRFDCEPPTRRLFLSRNIETQRTRVGGGGGAARARGGDAEVGVPAGCLNDAACSPCTRHGASITSCFGRTSGRSASRTSRA
jgi:hypothetical protein